METVSYSIANTPAVVLRGRKPIDQLHPRKTEKVFTVGMLFYTTGAVVPLLVGNVESTTPSPIKPVDLAIKVVLYVVAFFFMSRSWRSLVRATWQIRWILLPILIGFISAIWSQYPSLTLRGSAVLLATTIVGIYFGVRYTIPQQLRLLSWTFLLAVVSSFFLAIFLPQYGTEQHFNIGDWQGAFIQKNNLAEVMVLAFFVFLFVRPWISPRLRWLGIAGSLALLFLSGSATGVVVCFVLIVMLPLYKLVRAPLTLVIPVGLGLGLLLTGALVLLNNDPAAALQIINRSPDLTGRAQLWNGVLLSIAKRPWLGYGFSAFWEGMNGESASVLKAAHWQAGYAHNGFLDLVLQLGFVGLVTFLIGYLILCRRALINLSRTRGPAPIWLCTYLAFMLFYNFTEGSILVQNSIYWILYISTAVGLFSRFTSKQQVGQGT